MQTFTVHALHHDGRAFEQPIEADDRYHAVELVQKAWPLARIDRVDDDPIAGYDAITGKVLFEDDEFDVSWDDDGLYLKRTIDTTAEDAR